MVGSTAAVDWYISDSDGLFLTSNPVEEEAARSSWTCSCDSPSVCTTFASAKMLSSGSGFATVSLRNEDTLGDEGLLELPAAFEEAEEDEEDAAEKGRFPLSEVEDEDFVLGECEERMESEVDESEKTGAGRRSALLALSCIAARSRNDQCILHVSGLNAGGAAPPGAEPPFLSPATNLENSLLTMLKSKLLVSQSVRNTCSFSLPQLLRARSVILRGASLVGWSQSRRGCQTICEQVREEKHSTRGKDG